MSSFFTIIREEFKTRVNSHAEQTREIASRSISSLSFHSCPFIHLFVLAAVWKSCIIRYSSISEESRYASSLRSIYASPWLPAIRARQILSLALQGLIYAVECRYSGDQTSFNPLSFTRYVFFVPLHRIDEYLAIFSLDFNIIRLWKNKSIRNYIRSGKKKFV